MKRHRHFSRKDIKNSLLNIEMCVSSPKDWNALVIIAKEFVGRKLRRK